MTNIKDKIFNPADLGKSFRRERRAFGLRQEDIAKKTRYRRETFIQLEAGENVGVHTLLAGLAAMGKGLMIVDARPDLDDIKGLFDEED